LLTRRGCRPSAPRCRQQSLRGAMQGFDQRCALQLEIFQPYQYEFTLQPPSIEYLPRRKSKGGARPWLPFPTHFNPA
jgi:hypothetical protein